MYHIYVLNQTFNWNIYNKFKCFDEIIYILLAVGNVQSGIYINKTQYSLQGLLSASLSAMNGFNIIYTYKSQKILSLGWNNTEVSLSTTCRLDKWNNT